jgi:hypothetical protein
MALNMIAAHIWMSILCLVNQYSSGLCCANYYDGSKQTNEESKAQLILPSNELTKNQ